MWRRVKVFADAVCAAALLFFFIIGALCPLIVWLLTKRYPDSWLNYVKYVCRPSFSARSHAHSFA